MYTRIVKTKKESGSYLVLAAFILVVLMVTAGLTVDISRKFMLEQTAQDVADSAALAGADMMPDSAKARQACIEYIQQHSAGYVPYDSDIQITVSDEDRSGTVGVLVTGAWDPVIMPTWLVGNELYGITRYAIAVAAWDTSSKTIYGDGDLSNPPGGSYALFVGDTNVGSSLSGLDGNNLYFKGDVHINGSITVSNSPQNTIVGSFEAGSSAGGGGIAVQDGVAAEPWPEIDADKFVNDVYLDKDNPADIARYGGAGASLLGTNGQPVKSASGVDVTCRWDGSKFIITTDNSNVTAASSSQTATWGNGVDVKVNGSLDINLPNTQGKYWLGSFQVSGTISVPAANNNTELHGLYADNADPNLVAIEGKDNAGLAVYAGASYTADQTAIDIQGNQTCWYGTVYTPGRVNWGGNFNNYNANDEGTDGNYDASGNGFVKGSVICGSITSTNNNFQIYYDAALSDDFPITNSPQSSPPRYSTPTVWLQK